MYLNPPGAIIHFEGVHNTTPIGRDTHSVTPPFSHDVSFGITLKRNSSQLTGYTMVDSGIGAGPIKADLAIYTAVTILTALAWYNVLELNFLIFNSFKRYGGLYFWSLFVCGCGTALHALGFILKFFPTGTNIYLSVSIITVGWYCMVTGQSVVLYSRVHIVVRNQKVFRALLTMIIVDGESSFRISTKNKISN